MDKNDKKQRKEVCRANTYKKGRQVQTPFQSLDRRMKLKSLKQRQAQLMTEMKDAMLQMDSA